MNKSFQTAALAAFILFVIGASVCSAQIAGGYFGAENTDKDVVSAANFAVAAQSKAQKGALIKLVSIDRAEKQVVAGLNYRLCLTVKSGKANETVTAVVYQDLQNKFSLSEWQKGACESAVISDEEQNGEDETVSYKGKLEVGKTNSTILYVGEESGDYAAFCFTNNSEAGRKILAACKTGEQCEFSGKVDFEKGCKVKGLEADLSASGTITSIESVKSLAPKRKTQTKTAPVSSKMSAPELVVKNLYEARKNPKTDPFFQKKNRALLDKFFIKELADLIWKDAVSVKPGEAGTLDFDPLFAAQDMDITDFVIGKADENNVVKVTFKNFGKDEEIKFFLTKENTASKEWKIDTIMYSDAEDLGSMLEYGMMTEAEMKAAEKEDKLSGDYMVGTVKCNIAQNRSGYYARVKCDDQENFQVIDTESLTFGTFNPNEKGRKGHFVSSKYGSIEKFVDASGKEFKVRRLK